jgi:ATP-dependent DNA helicase PIF1
MNEKQQYVFDKVREGRNVFLTGEPGTGKSYTIHAIIKWAEQTGKKYGITAMTGVAAVLIGGTTLHSFLGIGLAKENVETLVRKACKIDKLRKKLRSLEMLIIDEISMMDADLFSKCDQFLRIVRNRGDLPFGGVQLICVGDFSQLAPCEGDYCFRAKIWGEVGFEECVLTEAVRHGDDIEFQEMLKRLRWGKCSDADYERLLGLANTTFPEHIVPTRLYSLNVNVDKINNEELEKIMAKNKAEGISIRLIQYKIRFPNELAAADQKKYAKQYTINEIALCVGCQVVLIKNLDQENGLVNGARGIVTFVHPEYVEVEFINGTIKRIDYHKLSLTNVWEESDHEKRRMDIYSLPLKLAWAITIHRTIGMTLDAVEIDLGQSIFAYGQAYTALSRARSLSSIRLTSVTKKSFKTHPHVIAFYYNLLHGRLN